MAVALLGNALPGSARAQSDSTAVPTPQPYHVWLGGGLSFPASGRFKDTWGDGSNARGMFSYQSAGMPIGLRLDVGYQEFEWQSAGNPEGSGLDASIQMVSILVDLTHDFHLGPIRPYVAIGAGVHVIEPGAVTVSSSRPWTYGPLQEVDDNFEFNEVASEVALGINGAIGLKLSVGPSLMLFAEGRIDNVFADQALNEQDDLQMIPVTLGIIF